MGTIAKVAEHFARAAGTWQAEAAREVQKNAVQIADLIREQLYCGLAGDEPLTPSYSDDPYFKTQAQAEAYREWKMRITPPAAGQTLGLPPRDADTPNLYINGYYHTRIEAVPIADGVRIGVGSDEIAEAVTAKYGDRRLYSLGTRAKEYVANNYVKPALRRIFAAK